MRALALALLLISSLALAEPPADAPYAEGRSVVLEQGDAAPWRALCLEESEALRREWIAQRDRAELDALRRHRGEALLPVPALVALVAGSLALGVAIGVGATLAARR